MNRSATVMAESAFSTILEGLPSAVVVTNPQRVVLWVNRAFTDICGYSREEFIGAKPAELLQGPETDEQTVKIMRRALRQGRPCDVELLNYHKKGTTYWADIRIRPVMGNHGEVDFFFALITDITNTKIRIQSEQAYLLTLYERLTLALDCPPATS
ncbi:MAG: PAS domain-containing protein [Candidatus Methylacidiphilales bacterium]